jgi:hypothetical protein
MSAIGQVVAGVPRVAAASADLELTPAAGKRRDDRPVRHGTGHVVGDRDIAIGGDHHDGHAEVLEAMR